MKKTLLSLILIFFTFITQAQIVNIPDAAFKENLIYQGIDSNNNSEIEVTEALAATNLEIGTEEITNLTGLEAFQNLVTLKINYVQVNNLNVNTLTNLTELWITNVSATNYDFNNLTNLNILVIYESTVSNLNISNLTNLETLVVNRCQLTSLDLSTLSQLTILRCYSNSITSITLPTTNIIQSYGCSGNQLTNINLTGFTNLKSLLCGENPLASLDISNNSTLEYINFSNLNLNTITVQNLPSIRKIECTGGQLTSIDLSQVPSLEELIITNTPLASLSLANLPNLTTLNCSSNQLTGLDLTNLNSLTELICSTNPLTSLNLVQVPQLKELICVDTAITSFDFSASANLELLTCTNNPLTTINFTGLTNLKNLNFGNTALSEAQNLSALTNVTHFSMCHTTLQSIDISPLQELFQLDLFYTPLVTLDFSSNTKVRRIMFEHNENLEYLNSNNGKSLQALVTGPYWIKYSPNLTKVCTAQVNIAGMRIVLTHPGFFNNIENPLVLSYCNFAPNGNYNTVTGTVTFDLDNTGCDANDILVKNAVLNLTSGITQNETLTNANGVYNFYPAPGNYTLSPNLGNDYFTINPSSVAVTFADYNNNVSTNNFCLTANGVKNDLNIVILPNNEPRPGFSTRYYLIYKNTGNQILSGSINLNFNDDLMNYIQSANLPDIISLNNLSWNFTNLLPFESRSIYFTMDINSPSETPAVNAGDVLNFTATISPITGDETPNDNVFNLAQTAVNSFDPNDKTCLEGNFITPEMVGDYLHYIIRFQNIGTANALNVVVKDVIDTTKFDMSSLQFTDSSHPTYTRILNNTVEFIFEGINLPAEMDDEPNSHGFVAFKIKTKNNLVLGNTIENTAEIYFDFNFPIITNTTSTTISLLNTNELENNGISVSPIPVKETLQIKAKDNITLVELFDVQGRLLQTKSVDDTQTALDFSGKRAGLYLVKIYTDNGVKVQKVIKE